MIVITLQPSNPILYHDLGVLTNEKQVLNSDVSLFLSHSVVLINFVSLIKIIYNSAHKQLPTLDDVLCNVNYGQDFLLGANKTNNRILYCCAFCS